MICPKTQKIIIVMGLSALGRRFSDVCQRHQLAEQVIGSPERETVSMKTIEQLLIEGYLKPLSTLNLPLHVALNQVDAVDKFDAVDADPFLGDAEWLAEAGQLANTEELNDAERLAKNERMDEAGQLKQARGLIEVERLTVRLTKRFNCSVSVHSLDTADRIPPFVVMS